MSVAQNIVALMPNGSTENVTITPSATPPWALLFEGIGMIRRYEARDLFEALTDLRREVEKSGGRLLCAGARRDVYPSGMAREMGGARKAYVMPIGAQARDLVDIFEPASPDQVGTVDEQEAYRARWIAALRETAK